MNDEELTPREIEELGRVMDSLYDYEHNLETPPDFVWDAIEADLDETELERTVDLKRRDMRSSTVSVVSTPHESVVTDIKQRRNFGTYLAAAAVLAVAVFGLINFLSSSPEEVVIASGSISNDGMPLELPATGMATLVSVDGVLQLDVDVEQLETDTDGYFELWIATSDASDVRSLGPIDGDGRFDLPDDFDRSAYPAVAISLEEDDDPAFGGVPVLFGVLDP